MILNYFQSYWSKVASTLLFFSLIASLGYAQCCEMGTSRSPFPDPWVVEAHENWMGRLPDDVRLADLSIPGTHNSAALHGVGYATNQTWTITEQLDAGIRFFDLRCRPTLTGIAIHHGDFYQHINFDDILAQVTTFLSDHSSETVILQISHADIAAVPGSKSLDQLYREAIHRGGRGRFFQAFRSENPNNPTLSEVRGKVYVLSKTGDRELHKAYHGRFSSGCDIDKQDLYEINPFADCDYRDGSKVSRCGKVNAIHKSILCAPSTSNWVMNYLSGFQASDVIPAIRAEADFSNRSTLYYLKRLSAKRKLGILMMDFPGEDLVHHIVQSNLFADQRQFSTNNPEKAISSASCNEQYPFPADLGGAVGFEVSIDCHISGVDNRETNDTISVAFLDTNGDVIDCMSLYGIRSCGAVSQDQSVRIHSSRDIGFIEFTTDGGDAFLMDQFRLKRSGQTVLVVGDEGGKGWCLSTDIEDDFRDRTIGGCRATWRFPIEY